jgi:hypothetical protein
MSPEPRFLTVLKATLFPSAVAPTIGRGSSAPSVTVPETVVPSTFRSTVIGCTAPRPAAAGSSPVHFPAAGDCANAAVHAAAITKSKSFTFIASLLTVR